MSVVEAIVTIATGVVSFLIIRVVYKGDNHGNNINNRKDGQ